MLDKQALNSVAKLWRKPRSIAFVAKQPGQYLFY